MLGVLLGQMVGRMDHRSAGSSFIQPNVFGNRPVLGPSPQKPMEPLWKASVPESDGKDAVRSIQWVNEGATQITIMIKSSQSAWCDGLDSYPINFNLKPHEHKLISLQYPRATLDPLPSYKTAPLYLDWEYSAPSNSHFKGSTSASLPILDFYLCRNAGGTPVVSTFILRDETQRPFELRNLRISRGTVSLWNGEGPWRSVPGHGLSIRVDGLDATPGPVKITAEYRQSPNFLWRPTGTVKYVDFDRKPVDVLPKHDKPSPVPKTPLDVGTSSKVEKPLPEGRDRVIKDEEPLRVVSHIRLSKDTGAELLAAKSGSVYVVAIVRLGREIGRVDVRRLIKDDFDSGRIPGDQNFGQIMRIVLTYSDLDGHIHEVVPTSDGCLVDIGLFPKSESWPVVRADLIFRWRANAPNELELFDANQGGQPASAKPKRLPRFRGVQYLVSNDTVYVVKGSALVKTPVAVLPPYISGEPKPWLVYGIDDRRLLLKRYSPVHFAGEDSYDRMAVDLLTHKVSVLPSLSTPDP